MSFAVRQINLQFLNTSNQILNLEGLRCSATITNPGGSMAFGQLQLKVYGMTLAQMNEYSSIGTNLVAVQKQSVIVNAGNQGDVALSQVFKGNLMSSYIDLSNLPNISFTCAAFSAYLQKATPIASNTYQGAHDAADIIKAIALANNLKFYNNGATAILQNQYVYGSAVDQIRQVALNASIPIVIENDTITIFPNNGYRDDLIINMSPETGMVGYPSYWEAGFVIRSEFNPQILNGRQMKVTSSLPKANGTFAVQSVTHEISTLTPDGAWFTTTTLSPPPYVAKN